MIPVENKANCLSSFNHYAKAIHHHHHHHSFLPLQFYRPYLVSIVFTPHIPKAMAGLFLYFVLHKHGLSVLKIKVGITLKIPGDIDIKIDAPVLDKNVSKDAGYIFLFWVGLGFLNCILMILPLRILEILFVS